MLTLNLSGNTFANGSGIIQNAGTTLTLTNAGILKSGGASATITGGTIQAGPAGISELVIRADQSSDKLFINSVLTAGGVTKSGLGSLILNLTGRYVVSGGKELNFEACMVTNSCSWIPPIPPDPL